MEVLSRIIKKEKKSEVFLKRIIDIIGAIIGIILSIPITIAIVIARIFIKDKGPIFYSQERIGKNGEKFRIYKYRSMVVDADKKLKKYLEENEELRQEYKKYKKLKNDPRITKIGEFIRKTNIDEFPQFINILKGDMSLVGPRPYLEQEIKDMGDAYNYIICRKPGITGLWQVNAETKKTFEQRLDLDIEYLSKSNWKIDMDILFKTVLKLFKFRDCKSYKERI